MQWTENDYLNRSTLCNFRCFCLLSFKCPSFQIILCDSFLYNKLIYKVGILLCWYEEKHVSFWPKKSIKSKIETTPLTSPSGLSILLCKNSFMQVRKRCYLFHAVNLVHIVLGKNTRFTTLCILWMTTSVGNKHVDFLLISAWK